MVNVQIHIKPELNLQMAEQVSTIVIGASCYGCGAAAMRPDSLIFEPTVAVGPEFTLTGCPARNLDAPLRTPGASALREELERRKAIENGLLHNAALSPVLAKWCLDRGVKIRFNAPVIRLAEHAVTVLEVSGLKEYSADEIIDARPLPGKVKFLYSFLAGGETGRFDGFEVLATASPEHRLVRQMLPLDAGYREARQALLAFWEKRPAELKKAVFLWSSSRFSFDTVDNPVSALDRGLEGGAK